MAKLVLSRQQGNALWRTQGGAFLLGKKKHRSDRCAYRTMLRNETMKLRTNLRSSDEICDAVHATEGNNLHLGKVLNGAYVVEDAYVFSSLKGQLYAQMMRTRNRQIIHIPPFTVFRDANISWERPCTSRYGVAGGV